VCNVEKPLSEFYKQKKHSKKKGTYYKYKSECKDCSKTESREWTLSHPKERSKHVKNYYNSPGEKEDSKIRGRKWREEGKQREYYHNIPNKLRIYRQKRYHKKHNITDQEWKQCKKYFDNSCAYCGLSEEEQRKRYKTDLHKEHAFCNGKNDLSNCVPACLECNSEKHLSDLYEWYTKDNNKFTYEKLSKIEQWLKEEYDIK
jgi:hypothetical protein